MSAGTIIFKLSSINNGVSGLWYSLLSMETVIFLLFTSSAISGFHSSFEISVPRSCATPSKLLPGWPRRSKQASPINMAGSRHRLAWLMCVPLFSCFAWAVWGLKTDNNMSLSSHCIFSGSCLLFGRYSSARPHIR